MWLRRAAGVGVYLRLRTPPVALSIPRAPREAERRLDPRFADHPDSRLRAILADATKGAACTLPELAARVELREIRDEAAARGDDELLATTTALERCVSCEADWAGHCFIARRHLGTGVHEQSRPRTLDPDELEQRSAIPSSAALPNSTR